MREKRTPSPRRSTLATLQANPDGSIIYRSELNPKCRKEMRIVALIDDRDVIERILRHRTGDDVRERLSARGRGDLFCRQASGPVAVPSGRVGAAPTRPEGTATLILTPPPCFGYRLPHKSAPSGQSQRACARAACKAISYQ